MSYTKNNSKWVKDLNVRAKTINLLEGNKVINLNDHGLVKFLNYDTKRMTNKRKNRYVVLDQILKNCATKGYYQEKEMTNYKMEEDILNHIFNKTLVSSFWPRWRCT